MKSIKPGTKTTEFWAMLFGNALAAFELIFGGLSVDNDTVMIALAIINGSYAASRGIAKN